MDDSTEGVRPGFDSALIYGAGAFGYLVVRLFILARGDVGVALALADTASPTTLFAAAVLGLTPLVLVAGSIAVAQHIARRRPLTPLEQSIRAVLFTVGALLLPFVVLGIGALVLACYRVPGLRRRGPGRALRWFTAPPEGVSPWEPLEAVIIVSAFLAAPMYLPLEAVQPATPAGAPAIVGYVLGSEGGFTSVLRDEDRSVIRLKDNDVTSRQLCVAHHSLWSTSFLTVWDKRPRPHSCGG